MSAPRGSGLCSEMEVEDEGVKCRRHEDSKGGIALGETALSPQAAVGFSNTPQPKPDSWQAPI